MFSPRVEMPPRMIGPEVLGIVGTKGMKGFNGNVEVGVNESRNIEGRYGLDLQSWDGGKPMEPKTMQKTVQISSALTDESYPRSIPGNVKNPTPARGACHECGSTDHFRPACPRLNRAQGPRGNHPNPVATNNGGQSHGNQWNQARGKAFMLGVEEARQDPNIVTGIDPSELGFRYEIEIASGQLVEIDKVIKGCKLEIEGHVFVITLIPFGHGSFDVIISMDWLSNHKAKIICHKKVIRIPLLYGKVLRVLRERPKEKARLLMSAKASDKKQKEIVVVRAIPEVFLDGLSGLPLLREIEFRIELIPGAVPVAKSPYRLAPYEMEELIARIVKNSRACIFYQRVSHPQLHFGNPVNAVGGKTSIKLPFDPNMPALEDNSIFDFSRGDEDDGVEADMNNLDTTIQVSPKPTTRIHKDHPLD
ncbi:putative reverse transcriptase domain-containing protein [Tanacetum coccineum]|uniref:Reverse transcriptase domain-containing protein n=1 Tax=Tanacetum coccineum TaxID=301880 RepID=A0ABQ4XMG8_9ASTR